MAQRLFGPETMRSARPPGRCIGHLYPVWLKFRGGKGVATLLGILIALLLAGGGGLRRRLACACC